uniref:Odorant receptor n=1 Tax=Leucinodes orbonalis TaxID=711050 RepID=A0AAU0QP72_9NEOP|nr:odorant receptor [Leucinodes orbonalis]
MDEKFSYLSVAHHIKYLQACGQYRLDKKSPEIWKFLHTIYMRSVLIFFVFYTFQQVLKINEVRDDIDKVMGTIFLFLTYTDWTYKCIIYWKKSEEINDLLDVMKGIWLFIFWEFKLFFYLFTYIGKYKECARLLSLRE